jgi:hypothetical protein
MFIFETNPAWLWVKISCQTQEYCNLTDNYIGPEIRSADILGGRHGEVIGRRQGNRQKK